MKYKLILCLIILFIFSAIVFASNTPPPIPTEYWGEALIDGEQAPAGTPITSDYGNTEVTGDGYYDVILTGGDSPLTYLDDPTCAIHEAADEACINCSTNAADENYCIEGPQDGDEVYLILNGANITVEWDINLSDETDLSVLSLASGWNLRSLNLDESDNSIEKMIQGLTTPIVVWNYNESGDWNVYDTEAPFPWLNTLNTMEYGKAYWIKSNINQNFGFAGTPAGTKVINLKTGWNFVGFNNSEVLLPDAISGLTTPIVVWEYNESGDWNVYDTEAPFPWLNTLQKMRQTMGYWIKSTTGQVWGI